MTPKEKAEELINKFCPHVRWKMGQEDYKQKAKQCALIAIDEIISDQNGDDTDIGSKAWWWNEVKQEIEKL